MSIILLSAVTLIFCVIRWQPPEVIPLGISRAAVNIGALLILILPCAILLIHRSRVFIGLIVYAIVVDFYFIPFEANFKYLVDTGLNECIGYNDATDYPLVKSPGIPLDELFQAPRKEEINGIIKEWKGKEFIPRGVVIEYSKRFPNGDSVKVVSHVVNGEKQFGLIRLPAGIQTRNAPILLGLDGGGSGIDVVKESFLSRVASGSCRDVLNNYILIAPSFRGDIIRGEDYCFRSGGYTGDVWAGAAEDAISFLEVVKAMYGKDESTKVLAWGISRGATVALIIGALTDKLDHSISISTHTNFLNKDVFEKERVGSDFQRVFFTPQATPSEIRKRMITSSPYYFAENLGSFEIHQGTEDVLTTVYHSKALQQRMRELGRNDSSARFYFYEGKGHGYDDDKIVCESLNSFVDR